LPIERVFCPWSWPSVSPEGRARWPATHPYIHARKRYKGVNRFVSLDVTPNTTTHKALPACPLSYHHFWTCSHTHTRTEIVFRPFNSFPGQALPFCLFVFNFPLSILFIFRPSRHKKNTKIDAPLSLSCCWAGSQNQLLDSTPLFLFGF
jgi:hypothetical protein